MGLAGIACMGKGLWDAVADCERRGMVGIVWTVSDGLMEKWVLRRGIFTLAVLLQGLLLFERYVGSAVELSLE